MRNLLMWVVCALPLSAQTPLLLSDILDAVEKHYPPLLVALGDRDIAEAEVLQALGRFDLVIAGQADTERLGYYPNQRLSLGFEQPLQTLGASTYGGWRVSEGSIAPYAGALETRALGEWRGGIKVPLLRNREIDERRGGLQKARIGRRIADLSIDQQRLVIRQLAARKYWDWTVAGQRWRVSQGILRVAQERDEALREAVALGHIPAIEVTENQRQILQRRSQLVEAQRGLEQTSIDLSLFFRDSSGRVRMPTYEQLPAGIAVTEGLADDQIAEDRRRAQSLRPEIGRLAQQKEQAAIDVRLAENENKPVVDLSLGFTNENGDGKVQLGRNEVKASLRFELPFQRRTAAGKISSARVKLTQIEQRERFAREQIDTEVADAASAVRAAHSRAALAKEEVRVALELADAERERFRLGDSNLFTVNLREQSAVDAEFREVSAVSDYLRAFTLYEQVTARLLVNP